MARRLIVGLARVVVSLGLVATSLVLHLPTRGGRVALRDIVAGVLPGAVPGRLVVGAVDVLSPREIRLSGVSYADARGAPLLGGAVVSVRPAWRLWGAITAGRPYPEIDVHARTAWARVPYFEPSPPPQPSAHAEPAQALSLPSLRITVDEVRGALPQVPLSARNLRLDAGLALNGATTVDLRSLGLTLDAMGLRDERVDGSVRTSIGDPLRVQGALRLRGPSLDCDVSAETDAAGRIATRLHGCALTAGGLDTLARRAPDQRLGVTIAVEDASVHDVGGGMWDARVALRLNGQPVALAGRLSATSQTLDVVVRHLSARSIAAAAPVTDLDGIVHIERHVEGDTQRFVVDTSRLVAAVSDVPVPPVRAAARLRGSLLTVDDLASPDIGLSARGSIDLERGPSEFHAEANVSTPEISRYPWVAGRASGALRLHAEVNGRNGRLTAEVHGTTQRLRLAGVRAESAALDATASLEHEQASVDVTVAARRLVVPGALGPADVSMRAVGDPRGRLRTRVTAHGDGLLAALGPAAAGQRGATAVSADVELDLSNPGRFRTRLVSSSLTLRGVRARVSGDVAVLRRATRGELPSGRLRIESDGHGSIAVALSPRRVEAQLDALDLAWLRPLVPGAPAIDGVATGSVSLDPDDLRGARVSLRLERGHVDRVGAVSGQLDVTPSGGLTSVALVVASGRPGASATSHPRVVANLQVAPPRRLNDVDAWFAGVRGGRFAVEDLDLSAWNDLLPTGLGAQGRVSVTLDLSRPATPGPLRAEAHVEARNLTGGLRLAGRLVPAVVPLTLRAVGCTDLQSAAIDGSTARLRVALTPWHSGDAEPAARPCGNEEPLLPRSFAAVDWGVRGPWLSAARSALEELRTPTRPLSAATQARLAATHVNLRVKLGPMLRAEWPLRAVPLRGADGRPRMLQPPDLPADAMLLVETAAAGPALGLGVDVNVDFRASALPQIGLDEPISARLISSLRPVAQGTLLGAVEGVLDGAIELSPNALAEDRGLIALTYRARANGAQLMAGATSAVVVDRFEVDTQNMKLERFAWARARGVRGALELQLHADNVGAEHVSAWAKLSNLRARIGGVDDPRETPPVQIYTSAALVPREGEGNTLRSCLHATARAAMPACDPLSTEVPDSEASLFALATIPMLGSFWAPRPSPRDATVQVHARRFRLETLTPFVRDDNIAGIGGALEASLRWDGRHPEAFFTDLHVADGRAEIISLGEPLRELALDARIEGPRARIDTMSAAIGRGHVDLTGTADLTGLLREVAGDGAATGPRAVVAMRGETRQMPIGVEGNTYGWIDGAIRYSMEVARDGATGTLDIERASVLLKEEQTRDLQPLSVDRDVFLLGRTATPAARAAAAFPMSVRFASETPIWIRRSDLAVALRAHGDIHRERGGWGVAGVIEQANAQSWFSVLGKRFELDRTRVVFDGGVAINPQLDVAAHHDSTTLGRLTAIVGGRLRGPSMAFGAVNFPDATQAEILAMIALGRRDSQGASGDSDLGQQAGTQFASLITAMTLGTVNSGLSRSGGFLPTIILEPGQGATSGRYGAGLSLGPRVYLQATYGAASNALGQANSTTQMFRVLLELAISQAWSASAFGDVGRAEGATQGSTGFDVFWSP